MSVTKIPESVKIRLWGKAGGRCQYEGCNAPLWLDSLTKADFNTAYIAHIIADSEKGPRADKYLSKKLSKDISNLMLMCDEHHRLIDKIDVKGHPVERLKEMKKKHEERIELLTSIQEEKKSHVVLYGANIGKHTAFISWDKAAYAMVPDFYPAEKQAIEISLKNSSFTDNEKFYWEIEEEQLERQFKDKLKSRIQAGDIEHLSIFAFAPQPLLIKLGHLLSDIPAANVYQLHREPPNWKWEDISEPFEYEIFEPKHIHKKIALNLSISATISNERITNVLGSETSIWTMTIKGASPYNDILQNQQQLADFRISFKKLLNRIKAVHGQSSEINIFPAVPIAVAVEIGRVRVPKADLPFNLYDQNNGENIFKYTFKIE